MTASTDGMVGVAVVGELGTGWVMRAGAGGEAHGEALSGYVGTAVGRSAEGLEVGTRVDYVGVDAGGELRIGGRVGYLTGAGTITADVSLGLARARTAGGSSLSLVGFELRGGALIGGDEMSRHVVGWRGFVGVTYAKHSFGATHDPLTGLFEGGKQ